MISRTHGKIFLMVAWCGIMGAISGAHNAYAQAFRNNAWEFRSVVIGNGIDKAAYATLRIPADFFAHLKPDISDLRLVRDGSTVPYVATVEAEENSSARISARISNLSSLPGETTSFIADLGREGIMHNGITLETASENFRRSVIIEGSDDHASWRALNDHGQIFDYTVRDELRPVAVRDTLIAYPDATFRYLRVTIRDQGERPLAVRGVALVRNTITRARETVYKPSFEITQNSKDRLTEITLDLGAAGMPHRSGNLEISDSNFNRGLEISESNDKQTWRFLGHGYIFVINTPKFSGRSLNFSYTESHARYLHVAIINHDDAPLAVSGVTLAGLVRSILFFYDPAGRYELYLGNPRADRPVYDIEKISRYLDKSGLPVLTAGPVEKNPSYVPLLPPMTERAPYLLPTVLVLIVGVLAFLLWRIIAATGRSPR